MKSKLSIWLRNGGASDKVKKFNEYENMLWDIIEPYLDGCTLRPDAPTEAVEAAKKLKEIGKDYSDMQ